MSSPPSRSVSRTDVERFLAAYHRGEEVRDLEPLTGGFWSSAYGYRIGDEELVARFGPHRDGFEADRDAYAHRGPDLPVPEVLDVGAAPFGVAYAISRRHHGRFLEDMGAEVAPALRRLLDALRAVPPAGAGSWRATLLDRLVADQPPGWRDKLRAHPEADAVFEAACAELRERIPSLPERRDLVHGDLLHQNVLVSEDGARVNAVFSWKCSERGDHLYDTAWCTFWGDVAYPGIAAAARDLDIEDDDRHRCYELHIATTHLGWYAWTEDGEWLPRVIDWVSRR